MVFIRILATVLITVTIMMPLPVAASHLGFGDSGSCSDSESPGVSQSGEGPRICLAWAHCAMGAGQSGSTELDSDARRDPPAASQVQVGQGLLRRGLQSGVPGPRPGGSPALAGCAGMPGGNLRSRSQADSGPEP